MANHKATKKSIRQDARRVEVNTNRRSRIRTFIRKVEEAITAGKKDQAIAALRIAESEMMRGVNKGIAKLGTASRRVSRLNKKIKAIA